MANKKIVVIGSGPGGYVSAIRAAQLGADVAVLEKGFSGGVCLNSGCIPTKSLLYSAGALNMMKNAGELGIHVENVRPDFEKIEKRKNEAVSRLRKGVEYLLKKNGVRLVRGKGVLREKGKVVVEAESGAGEELGCDAVIIATGSVPAMPRVFGHDGRRIITSNEALNVSSVPETVLIVGAGAIGLEFACIYSAFGAKTTVVEMMEQILPGEDNEIAGVLEKSLKSRGVDIITGDSVKEISAGESGVSAVLASGKEISAGVCLVAAGRTPSRDGIELESLAVNDRGFFIVNERMETGEPGIYAIGDAAGGWLLAHKASAEGIVAAENACGLDSAMDYRSVPKCVYTFPETASAGISEAEAREQGMKVKSGKFPFSALGKAVVSGETGGLVKFVIEEETHEILGVQIVGPHATELISEISLAMRLEALPEDIAEAVHPHPTLSESVMEAARAVMGAGIHS